MRIFVASIVLFLNQAQADTLVATWIAPTTHVNGEPISKPITYTLYNETGAVIGTTTETTLTIDEQPETGCMVVTASVDGQESGASDPACWPSVVDIKVPGRVQGISIRVIKD